MRKQCCGSAAILFVCVCPSSPSSSSSSVSFRQNMSELVIVVTGANKGIGYEIVREVSARASNSFLADQHGAARHHIYVNPNFLSLSTFSVPG
jgi:hypothetical protein